MKSFRDRTWPVLGLAILLSGIVGSWRWTADAAEGKSRLFGLKKAIVVPEKKEEKSPLDYPMVGDRTGVAGMETVKVEGIGLVVGLNGTGSDPPPNTFRDQMLTIMRKQEVENPKEVLASDSTAIVLLRAFVPAGARKGDYIDVEVWVPPGDGTTSLKGGRVLEADLYPTLIARGQRLQGDPLVRVQGTILVDEVPGDEENSAALRKGRIIGQGMVMADRDFRIVLARDIRSGLKTRNLEHRINQRFFIKQRDRKLPVATAKDEKLIDLKLPRQYRYDIQRFLLVVRRIPMSVSQTFIRQATDYLREELLKPSETIEAALRLEAIGPDSIEVLKEGLKSRHEMVRFSAAQALCYLGDPAGAEVLSKLAVESNTYRAYALAALVALDHPATRLSLSKMLHAQSTECRYGAFRALWAYDERDPLVKGELLNNEFFIHTVDSDAPPMVHLSRNLRKEIVIFNDEQSLKTPILLRSRNMIITASAENGEVHITSFTPSPSGTIRNHSTCDLKLSSVIRTAVSMGATYPDIVDLLQQANQKKNLSGQLAVNATPRALPLEALDALASGEEESPRSQPKATRFSMPSLFGGDTSANNTEIGMTAATDEADEKEEPSDTKSEEKRSLFDRIFRRLAQ